MPELVTNTSRKWLHVSALRVACIAHTDWVSLFYRATGRVQDSTASESTPFDRMDLKDQALRCSPKHSLQSSSCEFSKQNQCCPYVSWAMHASSSYMS